ncbi:MAG: TFIIB-type zinc ribbon-containing protein [Candidatus Bathyarchaeia archaeon]
MLEQRCQECGGQLIADHEAGELVCKDCGLVAERLSSSSPVSQETDVVEKRRRPKTPEEKRMLRWMRKVERWGRWKTRKERRLETVGKEFMRICSQLPLQPEIRRDLREEIKRRIEFLSREGIIRGRGRSIEDMTFMEVYSCLNAAYGVFIRQATEEFFRANAELMAVLSRPASRERDENSAEKNEERLRHAQTLVSATEFMKKLIEKLEVENPSRVSSALKDKVHVVERLERRLREEKAPISLSYVILNKIDPSIRYVDNSNLYRLFDLSPFRGMFISKADGSFGTDERRISPAAKTYATEVEMVGHELFKLFMKKVPDSERKRKRIGLTCVCVYAAGYLQALKFISFTRRLAGRITLDGISYPGKVGEWSKFFHISEATFHRRLKELKKHIPPLVALLERQDRMRAIHAKVRRRRIKWPLVESRVEDALFREDFEQIEEALRQLNAIVEESFSLEKSFLSHRSLF